MDRRTFIIGTLACGCPALARAMAHGQHRMGCYVSGRAAANGTPVDYVYRPSSGVPAYDLAVRRVLDRITVVTGRPLGASLQFMDAYNAHVNPDPEPKVIAFGKALLDDLAGDDFELKLTCVAAHETAHILQFEDPYFDFALSDATVRRSELEADAFAGACLAFLVNGGRKIDRGVLEKKRASVQSAFQLVFKLGDNEFNNPNHHGTGQERLEAMDAGYSFSNEIASGEALSGDISLDIMDKARSIGVR